MKSPQLDRLPSVVHDKNLFSHMLPSYMILLYWVAFLYMMEKLQWNAKYKAAIFISQISLFRSCLQTYTNVEIMMRCELEAGKQVFFLEKG